MQNLGGKCRWWTGKGDRALDPAVIEVLLDGELVDSGRKQGENKKRKEKGSQEEV